MAENFGQFFIGRVSFLELPVRHLDADLLASYLRARLVENVEHLHQVRDPALPQVIRVQPERPQFLALDGRQDRLVDALNGAIVDVEPVEDDLEGGELRALADCLSEILHEISQHALLVGRKISVAAALEGQLHEGRTAPRQLQRRQLLLEVAEVLGGEELTGPLVRFVELGDHPLSICLMAMQYAGYITF
jgi:hypothetical protein